MPTIEELEEAIEHTRKLLESPATDEQEKGGLRIRLVQLHVRLEALKLEVPEEVE